MSKTIGIIAKVRHLLLGSARTLYMTLVEPYINYCNTVHICPLENITVFKSFTYDISRIPYKIVCKRATYTRIYVSAIYYFSSKTSMRAITVLKIDEIFQVISINVLR